MLTAAHCFSDSTSGLGTNTTTGAPLVRVSFDPNLVNTPSSQRTWYVGSYYFDPQFAIGAGGGLPGFDTHDVAIIVFGEPGCHTPTGSASTYLCGPVPPAATLGQYGALPEQGLVDRLPDGGTDRRGRVRRPELRLRRRPVRPELQEGTRRRLHPVLRADPARGEQRHASATSSSSCKSNKGGTCFGDSGGPNLVGGTNVVVGVNSFVANAICTANTYSYRVDTAEALAWIRTTAAAHGGVL